MIFNCNRAWWVKRGGIFPEQCWGARELPYDGLYYCRGTSFLFLDVESRDSKGLYAKLFVYRGSNSYGALSKFEKFSLSVGLFLYKFNGNNGEM